MNVPITMFCDDASIGSKSSPCVSVIVPVYNTQSYLARCIDSILAQTLNDIEIICVDDGSTDDSPDILEKYAAQDMRMHIVYQSHQNVGIARNTGLAMAQGEYVIFLDSDDFYAPETLEHIYRSAQENKSDIVLFNGCHYDDKKEEIVINNCDLRTDLLPEQTVFSWHDVPNYIFNLSTPVSWCKLYSRRFLLENELHFSGHLNAEDLCFTLLSLALAQRISTVSEVLIYHIDRQGSLLHKTYEQPLCFLAEYETLYQELRQRNLYIPLQTSFRQRALNCILFHLDNVSTSQGRIQILDALDNEPYCNLPFKEVPGIDDDNHKVHELYPRLIAAQEQYHSSLNALAAIECFNKLPQASKADPSIKVSVVIPVYNTEAYLDEALASIAGQTLKNIEIICINDGSTDDSLDILNRWAANDERFIIISQPNTGQGYARNVGITRARGEYLYFMDSDDLLERDALEQLSAIMDEKQLDSLYFDAETFFESAELEENYPDFRNQFIRNHSFDDVYDGPTLMRLFSEAGEYQVSPYIQFYRLDLIQAHNIRFPIGILHEDNVFTFEAMLHAKRASHIQHSFYSRRIRPDSVMTANDSFQNVYGRYRSFWEMLQIYHALSPEINEINRTAALNRIIIMLKVAQQVYGKLSSEEKYGRFGLIENLPLFNALIGEPGTNKANVQSLNNKVSELLAKLKESNAKRAEFFAQRNKLRDEKTELSAKLKESNAKRAEFFAQCNKLYDEKEEISQRLQLANQEKVDRDAQISELKKTIGKQQAEIEAIQNSWTYRIGRFFTWPVRKVRAIRSHSD